MPYSYVQYTGNGSQKAFTFSFSYLASSNIKVSINSVDALLYDLTNYLGEKTSDPTTNNSGGTLVAGALYYNTVSSSMRVYSGSIWSPLDSQYVYSLTSTNMVEISPAPSSGALVNIRRNTDIDTAVVDFADGSVLQERDLDLLAKFSLFSAQESRDEAGAAANAGVSAFNANNSAIASAASATASAASATSADASEAVAITKAAEAVVSATSAATSAAAAAASNASITESAATASAQAIIATTAAEDATAIAENSSISIIGSDLGGMGFAYDLGSIAESATGIPSSPPGNIVTVAANIDSVNDVAANIAAVNAAVTSASNAATSATNAANSATSAATSATNSSTSASNSASSASSALSYANSASTQAGIATTQATNAGTSASTATTQASIATTKASEASSSASAASGSASAAAASAVTASDAAASAVATVDDSSVAVIRSDLAGLGTHYDLGSITEAAVNVPNPSGGNIVTVATNIASVNTVSTSIANVNTTASNIAAINTNAANIVAIQNASTDAATATTQAGIATTKASLASTSESNAVAAQIAAEAARDATLAAYDNFDDRYLGSKTSDPTLDNDGNALVGGALYYNSTSGVMKLYNGTTWGAAYVSAAGVLLMASNLSDLQSVATSRTNLDVPTRTGGDASGTWSISITGNAATATNGVVTTGSYSNPSWITALDNSKVTGLGTLATKSTIATADITDAQITSEKLATTLDLGSI